MFRVLTALQNTGFLDKVLPAAVVAYKVRLIESVKLSQKAELYKHPQHMCKEICDLASFVSGLKQKDNGAFTALLGASEFNDYFGYWQNQSIILDAKQLILIAQACSQLEKPILPMVGFNLPKLLSKYTLQDLADILHCYASMKQEAPAELFQGIMAKLLELKGIIPDQKLILDLIYSYHQLGQEIPQQLLSIVPRFIQDMTFEDLARVIPAYNTNNKQGWAPEEAMQQILNDMSDSCFTEDKKYKMMETMHLKQLFMLLKHPRIDFYRWLELVRKRMPFSQSDSHYHMYLSRAIFSLAAAVKKHRRSNSEFFKEFCRSPALKQYLQSWEAHDLSGLPDDFTISSILWGYAQLGQAFPTNVLAQVPVLLPKFSTTRLSMLIGAYAKINLSLSEPILAALSCCVDNLAARDAANVTWACLKLGHAMPVALLNRVAAVIGDMNAKEVSMILSAHAHRARVVPDCVFAELPRVLPQAGPQEVANILVACVKLNVAFKKLPELLLPQVERYIDAFEFQELSDATWALDFYFALNPELRQVAQYVATMRHRMQGLQEKQGELAVVSTNAPISSPPRLSPCS
jgi:hypothetical protein